MPAGLYDFERLSLFIKECIAGVYIKLTAAGILNLDLRQILGIAEKGWISGSYVGDRPAKTTVHMRLYIYLDQLTTTSNLIDGKPSTLLAIIPAANGETADITPSNPMYKKLEVGDIHQLNLRVLDENGTIVQNREKSMTAILEIRENV